MLKIGLFPLSRIESNQYLAYKTFFECNNTNMVLMILWNNNVYQIDFGLLKYYDKSIDLKKIEPNITNWNEFVDNLNNNSKGNLKHE
jgi:hypothetical protein